LDTLGFSKVGEKPEYPAAFVSDGSLMITLWQAENPAEAVPFDRRNVIGLHHLALKVDGADALNALHGKLVDCEGVDVEFAPEPLGSGGTRHMMCSIPGGSRPSLSCERTTTCCSRSPCEALFTARSRRMSGLRMLRVIGTAMAILRRELTISPTCANLQSALVGTHGTEYSRKSLD
jgi:hypothetical protein